MENIELKIRLNFSSGLQIIHLNIYKKSDGHITSVNTQRFFSQNCINKRNIILLLIHLFRLRQHLLGDFMVHVSKQRNKVSLLHLHAHAQLVLDVHAHDIHGYRIRLAVGNQALEVLRIEHEALRVGRTSDRLNVRPKQGTLLVSNLFL